MKKNTLFAEKKLIYNFNPEALNLVESIDTEDKLKDQDKDQSKEVTAGDILKGKATLNKALEMSGDIKNDTKIKDGLKSLEGSLTAAENSKNFLELIRYVKSLLIQAKEEQKLSSDKENKDVMDYFGLSQEFLNLHADLKVKLKGFDVLKVVKSYKDLIEGLSGKDIAKKNVIKKEVSIKLNGSIGEITKVIQGAVKENNGSFDNLQWIANERVTKVFKDINDLFKRNDIKISSDIDKISFLSEEDKKIEDNAMKWYLGACLFQMIPYAGSAMSVPVDFMDAFSSYEGTIKYLQGLGLVDKRFKMEKSWADSLFGVVGIAGTVVGLQGLAKSGKVAHAVEKLRQVGKFDPKEIVESFGKRFGKSAGEIQEAQKLINGESAGDKSQNLYKSSFSDKIPEGLPPDTIAWINKDGSISYNAENVKKQLGIDITVKDGEQLFNGKTFEEFRRTDANSAKTLIEYLKPLKSHEVTHRTLESNGIKRLSINLPNGTSRIFGQEEISYIVDGTIKVSPEELRGLAQELEKKIPGLNILDKNGDLDPNAMRRFDTKNISNGANNFTREQEAAKMWNGKENTELRYKVSSLMEEELFIAEGGTKNVQIGNVDLFISRQNGVYTLNTPSGKQVLQGGITEIGRNQELSSRGGIVIPDQTVSRSHAEITVKGDKIFIKDLGSSNGTRYTGGTNNPEEFRSRMSTLTKEYEIRKAGLDRIKKDLRDFLLIYSKEFDIIEHADGRISKQIKSNSPVKAEWDNLVKEGKEKAKQCEDIDKDVNNLNFYKEEVDRLEKISKLSPRERLEEEIKQLEEEIESILNRTILGRMEDILKQVKSAELIIAEQKLARKKEELEAMKLRTGEGKIPSDNARIFNESNLEHSKYMNLINQYKGIESATNELNILKRMLAKDGIEPAKRSMLQDNLKARIESLESMNKYFAQELAKSGLSEEKFRGLMTK